MTDKKVLIDDLVVAFTCLPGVGKKTAQRMTYFLFQRAKKDALKLSDTLKNVVTNIKKKFDAKDINNSVKINE